MSKRDPFDLDTEELDEAERQQRQAEARKRELADIEWLMEHPIGRRVVARLLDKAGIHRTTFRPNSEMPFLEGMRNLGLMFYADVMEVAPENYIKLLQEQKELKEHERASQ